MDEVRIMRIFVVFHYFVLCQMPLRKFALKWFRFLRRSRSRKDDCSGFNLALLTVHCFTLSPLTEKKRYWGGYKKIRRRSRGQRWLKNELKILPTNLAIPLSRLTCLSLSNYLLFKANFGHFTLLFCRGQQRNVPRIITHVHSYCSAR